MAETTICIAKPLADYITELRSALVEDDLIRALQLQAQIYAKLAASDGLRLVPTDTSPFLMLWKKTIEHAVLMHESRELSATNSRFSLKPRNYSDQTSGVWLHLGFSESGQRVWEALQRCSLWKIISGLVEIEESNSGPILVGRRSSRIPLVYSLEYCRLWLNESSGIGAKWAGGTGAWRTRFGLELVVENFTDETLKADYDSYIIAKFRKGSILISCYDPRLRLYRVILTNPVNVDLLLQDKTLGDFRLMYSLGTQNSGIRHESMHVDVRLPGRFRTYPLTDHGARQILRDVEFIVTECMNLEDRNRLAEALDVPQAAANQISKILTKFCLPDQPKDEDWFRLSKTINLFNEHIQGASTLNVTSNKLSSIIIDDIDLYVLQNYPKMIRRADSVKGEDVKRACTYGELLSPTVSEILKQAGIGRTSLVCDLGCGIGKLLVQASLEAKCKVFGVEKVEQRVVVAREVMRELDTQCADWGLRPPRSTIELGGLADVRFWDEHIRHADLIVASNFLFEEKDNLALIDGMQMLRRGACVVVLTKLRAGLRGEGPPLFLHEEHRYADFGVDWHGYSGEWHIYRKM